MVVWGKPTVKNPIAEPTDTSEALVEIDYSFSNFAFNSSISV